MRMRCSGKAEAEKKGIISIALPAKKSLHAVFPTNSVGVEHVYIA